ncbi:MAG: hypothetical protein KC476_06100 [Cyanobacteria bacterium HKST-UBA06]|nr:hypothetical protein [Cyanobacteria bacterium HKST-UBA06]
MLKSAQSLASEDKLDEALCRLESAASLTPDSFEITYNMGILYRKRQQYMAALQAFEKALATNPSEPADLYYTKAITHHELADTLNKWAHELAEATQTEAPAQRQDSLDDFRTDMAKNLTDMALPEAWGKLDANALKGEAVKQYQAAIKAYQDFLGSASELDKARDDAHQQVLTLEETVKTLSQTDLTQDNPS